MEKLRRMLIEDSKDKIKRDVEVIKQIAFKKSNIFDVRDYKNFKESIAKELRNIKYQDEQIMNELMKKQNNSQIEIEVEDIKPIKNIESVEIVEKPRMILNSDVMVVYGD